MWHMVSPLPVSLNEPANIHFLYKALICHNFTITLVYNNQKNNIILYSRKTDGSLLLGVYNYKQLGINVLEYKQEAQEAHAAMG